MLEWNEASETTRSVCAYLLHNIEFSSFGVPAVFCLVKITKRAFTHSSLCLHAIVLYLHSIVYNKAKTKQEQRTQL